MGLAKSFSEKWEPDHVAAVLLLVICCVLLLCGINGEVKSILVMASGYLFGSRTQARKAVKS